MDGRPQGGLVSYLTPVLQVGGVSGTSIKASSGHATGAFTQHAPLRPRSAATHQAAGSAAHAGSVPLAAFTGWVSAQPASSGAHGFSSVSASPPGYSRQHSAPLYQQLSRTVTIPASALAGNSISAAAVAIGNAVAADAPRLMAAAAAAAHHQQQHHYQSNPSPPPSHWRSASAAVTTSSGSAAHHYPSHHHRSSFLSSPNAATATFAAASSAFGSPPAVASLMPPMPATAVAPGMHGTSGPTAGPHDSLIAQIEAQWSDYMAAVADEEANGATSKPASSAAANGRVSALPSLLAQLQSNSLLNFFEFTSQRAHLSIWGPSFDCLYFHAPAAAQFGAPVLTSQGIYRDRADYLATLAGLQTITFRCVDFQLLALHLPLMRQRMTRLRSITLVHNNCHSLWQLDQLAVLAPAAAGAVTSSSGFQTAWPASALESVVIRHNAVTALPLYRRYLVSLLCMNASPQSSTAQATASVHSPRSSARGASRSSSTASSLLQLQQLDGKPISDHEVREANAAFAAFHAAKYALDLPAASASSATSSTSSGQSSTPVSSRWMELLYETSVATAGGLTALGTAANPLHAVHWNLAHFGSASSLPLPPVRPVATTPQARKHARKLVDELLSGATHAANAQRDFDDAWEEALHGQGGVLELLWSKASAGEDGNIGPTMMEHEANRASSPLSSSPVSASPTASPPLAPMTASFSSVGNNAGGAHPLTPAQAYARAAQEKVRTMRLFLTTSTPSALLAAQATINQAARRKKAATAAAAAAVVGFTYI